MADLALPKNKGGGHVPSPPAKTGSLQRNPSTIQRNPSRRVYFDQTAAKKSSSIDDCENQNQSHSSRCYTCCAWVALTLGCLILSALILGGLFLSFLQGSMPDIRIVSFTINKLETETGGLLNADVQLKLNATNSHGVTLGYGPLRVEISSEHVDLGAMTIPAFTQDAHTSTTELNVQTKVNRVAVDSDDVEDLKSNLDKKEMVVDVVMKGTIDVEFKGHEMKGLPLLILCRQIDEAGIDSGLQPTCNVKIVTFG